MGGLRTSEWRATMSDDAHTSMRALCASTIIELTIPRVIAAKWPNQAVV
tara:strand:+ start:34194 stop:34340 length:147 start_codon:yes stop_codon:yes gene_type:complete